MDDLAALDMLSEDAIVDQLQHRYEQAQIYTYIGDILVAVNPFTSLGLYTGIVSNNNFYFAREKKVLLIPIQTSTNS